MTSVWRTIHNLVIDVIGEEGREGVVCVCHPAHCKSVAQNTPRNYSTCFHWPPLLIYLCITFSLIVMHMPCTSRWTVILLPLELSSLLCAWCRSTWNRETAIHFWVRTVVCGNLSNISTQSLSEHLKCRQWHYKMLQPKTSSEVSLHHYLPEVSLIQTLGFIT